LHYHKAIGRKAGLSDDQINDLQRFDQSSAYSAQEKAVLRFAEQWTRQGNASAEVMKELAQSLSPTQFVVLAATVGLANWTNRFNESFGVELP
jgi:alkylhydroperoxidase family enzyme